MYFHTDDPGTQIWLAGVLNTAIANGHAVRFDVDSQGRLKVKRGESMWSAPIASTPDAHRDLSQTDEQPDTDEGITCSECEGQHGSHFLNCSIWSFNP